jgi:hypothetical protein
MIFLILDEQSNTLPFVAAIFCQMNACLEVTITPRVVQLVCGIECMMYIHVVFLCIEQKCV